VTFDMVVMGKAHLPGNWERGDDEVLGETFRIELEGGLHLCVSEGQFWLGLSHPEVNEGKPFFSWRYRPGMQTEHSVEVLGQQGSTREQKVRARAQRHARLINALMQLTEASLRLSSFF